MPVLVHELPLDGEIESGILPMEGDEHAALFAHVDVDQSKRQALQIIQDFLNGFKYSLIDLDRSRSGRSVSAAIGSGLPGDSVATALGDVEEPAVLLHGVFFLTAADVCLEKKIPIRPYPLNVSKESRQLRNKGKPYFSKGRGKEISHDLYMELLGVARFQSHNNILLRTMRRSSLLRLK